MQKRRRKNEDKRKRSKRRKKKVKIRNMRKRRKWKKTQESRRRRRHMEWRDLERRWERARSGARAKGEDVYLVKGHKGGPRERRESYHAFAVKARSPGKGAQPMQIRTCKADTHARK